MKLTSLGGISRKMTIYCQNKNLLLNFISKDNMTLEKNDAKEHQVSISRNELKWYDHMNIHNLLMIYKHVYTFIKIKSSYQMKICIGMQKQAFNEQKCVAL